MFRRLLLVLIISFVPADTVFVPLSVTAVILLSTLLLLFEKPFRHPWDNQVEAISLFLLLLSYTSGVFIALRGQATLYWSIMVLTLNAIFVLVLVVLIIIDKAHSCDSACCQSASKRGELQQALLGVEHSVSGSLNVVADDPF